MKKKPVLSIRALVNIIAQYRNNHKILNIVTSTKDIKATARVAIPGKRDLESSLIIAVSISNLLPLCSAKP